MTISFSKAVIIPACWLNGEKIKIGVSILKLYSLLQTFNAFSPFCYLPTFGKGHDPLFE